MKRLVVFLVLLLLGFVALRFAIGDEDVVASPTQQNSQPPAPPEPLGVPLGKETRGMTGSLRGPLTLKGSRTRPMVDGRARIENVYTLTAKGSQPIAAGQQQLDGVEATFFDKGEPTATLQCARAFVTLRPDANGVASLDEGKDLDLRDAVVTGAPGSRLEGMRFEIGVGRVRIEEDTIALTTPRDEPVLLQLTGTQSFTLRGRGMQAMLPRRQDGALRRADIEILQQPVLTGDGFTVRADGRLHFVEELDAGVGSVTLSDGVAMDATRGDLRLPGASAARGDAGEAATVRGDQFVGWLLRVRERGDGGRERQRIDWRQLLLTGAPATITLPGSRLATPRVTVLPGLFGQPMLLTAHGGESRLEQTALRPGSKQRHPLVGTSSRPVHYVMPKDQLGALHRAFGFPRWSLRPLEQLQITVVEGAAQVTAGPSRYEASDGLRLYRRQDLDTGLARGFGRVRIEQRAETPREKDLVASGSDGFLLRATPKGDELQLGPELPDDLDRPGAWQLHEFDVTHGDARLRGRGTGSVRREGDVTTVRFGTPDAGMTATMPSEGLELQRVRRLDATFRDRAPVALDVAGWPLQFASTRGEERITGTAPRLLQTGPRSLRLLPADPAIAGRWSGLPDGALPVLQHHGVGRRRGAGPGNATWQQIEVRGPCIDVHHAGGTAAIVEAIAVGDDLPHVYAKIGTRRAGETTTIACAAERLRMLPFVLSPDTLRWHTGGGAGAMARIAGHGVDGPWLVVDRVREFELDDAEQGHVTGRARSLLVSQDARAALFTGDPDASEPAEVTRVRDGRTTTMRGARVRLFESDGTRLTSLGTFAEHSLFLPPTLTLHEAKATGLLAHMQATCRGSIEVRSEEIVFGGPVVATALQPDGSIDPDGLAIDAQTLHMTRHRDGSSVATAGSIRTVTAEGVHVVSNRLQADCSHLQFDVDRQRLVATDADEAHVVLNSGHEMFSPRIEVDYATLAVTMSSGRSSWSAPLARKQ